MIKKAMFTLVVMALTVSVFGQTKEKCASDDFYKEQVMRFPAIAAQKTQLEKEISDAQRGIYTNPKARTTGATDCWADDTDQIHIPVVVHVIYDYAAPGNVSISDNEIYGMISRLNQYYNQTNPDLPAIIPTWTPWVGNAHITFHLANKDPNNNPTKGIVRSYSYLAAGGDESAKLDQWAPDQYLNIYLENFIGRGASQGIVLAYSTFPQSYTSNPYSQGVISRTDQGYSNMSFGDASTIAHEVGHFISLYHPWNNNNQGVEGTVCGDDEVDDTPPTVGHFSCGTAKLYDTYCAGAYKKSYNATDYFLRTCIQDTGTIDYPDTTNTQNIMDYSACNGQMFTKGQVARMRATLRSSVGARANLVSAANLVKTGITDAAGNFLNAADLLPTASFSVNRPFVCADGSTLVTFTNRSYNDTLSGSSWTFGNGASSATSSSATSVVNTFSTPGWVSVSLTANGNNTGSNTLTRTDLVYAADPTPVNPIGYFQNFNAGGDLNRYPIFNYYGTDHKWELVNNAGVYDNTSIRYVNYDTRTAATIDNATATPGGNYADFYTPAFDLSSFGSICNISFYSAGAFRTNTANRMNDTLFIAASNDCGSSWKNQGILTGDQLGNNGVITDPFTPNGGQWKEQSVPVDPFYGRPAGSTQTYFRFRFKSGTDYATSTGFSYGTGNNFYLDRLTISAAPLGVKNGVIVSLGMNVLPNPTNGAATVSLNGGDNSMAELHVTDVTGKLVYSSNVNRTSATTRVEIPAESIAVKGMYLVKVVTNGATETQKLIVY